MAVLISALLRYRSGEIDYLDSDATWHTLLTIEAYNETPISQHLFLPIVSLGNQMDKYIPWGATVPDNEGNYYYTSFSPAGYFAPWLFMKIFGLSVNEESLYIFNLILLLISAFLWMYLLALVYEESEFQHVLCFIGGFSYVFLPEILHGMGIVYWHQSMMQVTLLLQVFAYYRYVIQQSKKWKYFFYLMALINPYIEWTGYVANAGFAISEMIRNNDKGVIKAFVEVFKLGIITVASFALFFAHYLLRIDPDIFLQALKNRFLARNITTDVALTEVFGGYYKSFLFVWILLLIFLIWNFVCNKRLEIRNGLLILVLSFPIVENIVMKQHAIAYTYDRMKGAFVLIFILCEVVYNILESNGKHRITVAAIIGLVCVCSGLNLYAYQNDASYVWSVSYKTNNIKLAKFVTEKYPKATYASGTTIRGYMNLLFHRGIYENISVDEAKSVALQRQSDYLVYITKDGYELESINVYDVNSDSIIQYSVNNGVVSDNENVGAITTADITDDNWTAGCSNTSNVILFNRDDKLLIQLLTSSKIIARNEELSIVNIDYDDTWIRCEVDRAPSVCKYPEIIKIE